LSRDKAVHCLTLDFLRKSIVQLSIPPEALRIPPTIPFWQILEIYEHKVVNDAEHVGGGPADASNGQEKGQLCPARLTLTCKHLPAGFNSLQVVEFLTVSQRASFVRNLQPFIPENGMIISGELELEIDFCHSNVPHIAAYLGLGPCEHIVPMQVEHVDAAIKQQVASEEMQRVLNKWTQDKSISIKTSLPMQHLASRGPTLNWAERLCGNASHPSVTFIDPATGRSDTGVQHEPKPRCRAVGKHWRAWSQLEASERREHKEI
jgi:hypothetical protein